MKDEEELLALAQRGVERALAAGASEAEVCASWGEEEEAALQQDDLHLGSAQDETTIGVRVIVEGRMGFATANGADALASTCEEAVALARAGRPEEGAGFADPKPIVPLEFERDARFELLGVEEVAGLARRLVDRVKSLDARVRIDSGAVTRGLTARAIANSRGVSAHEAAAYATASLFGMAVQDDEVGSFDYDSLLVRDRSGLEAALEAMAERYVRKCVGALGARPGRSFRGPVILSPEAVEEVLLDSLVEMMGGDAVRVGRSPLAGRLGEPIAHPSLQLRDDPRLEDAGTSSAFDREGTPTAALPLIEDGVLRHFLYDVYEARRAGVEPTGHAGGSAGSTPRIGPSNLIVAPGEKSFAELCSEPERAVVVTRFSGSITPESGEVSGVVKGGFLMEGDKRTPIKETLIAGNLYEMLRKISGISREVSILHGSHRVPGIRIDDVSITAG